MDSGAAGAETPIFVVILTDANVPTPRAVGPFSDFDVAQAFAQTLVQRWHHENREEPNATVVRVEADYPGIVVGEL